MRSEGIPQSVVEAAVAARVPEGQRSGYVAEWFRDGLVDALREYERLGYRLVRDDEATLERLLLSEDVMGEVSAEVEEVLEAADDEPSISDLAERLARAALTAALTAAQGGSA